MTHAYINEALQHRVDRIVDQRADRELKELISRTARTTGRNVLSDGWSSHDDLGDLGRRMNTVLLPRIRERIRRETAEEVSAAAIAAVKSFCEKAGG